jgi:hypothetical protein
MRSFRHRGILVVRAERISAMHFVEPSKATEPISADPRRMTRGELLRLGMPRLAYLRCGTIDGQPAYALHAADGTAMAVVEDIEVAIEFASENDMMFVSVH